MNKQLIGIAIAILIPMVVQADVTVSGTLQAEVMSFDQGTNGAVIALADGAEGAVGAGGNSTIALAFEGECDYGLTAFGAIKFMPIADDADADLANRDVYVGLKHDVYGAAKVGRMNSAYKGSSAGWDPLLMTALQARGSAGHSVAHNGYVGNTIEYAVSIPVASVTPAIKVQGVLDESGEDNHGYNASVSLPIGPVEIAGAYLDEGTKDATSMKVAAKYAGDVMGKSVSVAAQYEATDNKGYDGGEGTFIYANATVDIGALTPVVGYGMYSAEAQDADATYLAVGVLYALGENTRLHAGYRATASDIEASDATAIVGGIRQKF